MNEVPMRGLTGRSLMRLLRVELMFDLLRNVAAQRLPWLSSVMNGQPR
jgi:hypothetical protein